MDSSGARARTRGMSRPSMVSKDSTPLPHFSGMLKKKGRGKRYGVLNNEYLLLYMDKVPLANLPEPRSKYNVKHIKKVNVDGPSFALHFFDNSTRDFHTDDAQTANAWNHHISKRMKWFKGIVNAQDSKAKMEFLENKALTDKLKIEAARKLEEVQRMAKEIGERERVLKEKTSTLEKKLRDMREQQKEAREKLQEWEKDLEMKESAMLSRSDTLKAKAGKTMKSMFSWSSRKGNKKGPSTMSTPGKIKVTMPTITENDTSTTDKVRASLTSRNEVICPETGDSFTLSPVGLRFQVDCDDDSKARRIIARRASAAVGTLRQLKRERRQHMLSKNMSPKARKLLGDATWKHTIPGQDDEETSATTKDEDTSDPSIALRRDVSQCLVFANMEHLSRLSRFELEVGKGEGKKRKDLELPLNFDEMHAYEITEKLSCKDYASSIFSSLRRSYDIDERSYLESVRSLTGGGFGEGKSKMLFFMSKDRKYVMKTVKSHELEFFWEFIKDYYWHMIANPDTLLCRFFGLFTVTSESSSKPLHIVVMNNTFNTSWPIDLKFDLKGSINNRMVPPDQLDKVSVLKDLNLGQRHVWLPSDVKDAIVRQIKIDTWFLERNNIMDYSLLLGISEPLSEPPDSSQTNASGERRSRWEQDGGGLLCSRGACRRRSDASKRNSHECYVLSIIDILQQFTWKKQAESVWKLQKYGSARQISCVDAETYAARFREFINNSVIQRYTWLRTSLQDHATPGRPSMKRST